MEDKVTQGLESNLAYQIERHNEGEAELSDIQYVCRKIEAYKRNVGMQVGRIKHNPREKAFHEQWLEENISQAGINNGHGILQDLFIDRDTLNILAPTIVKEEISHRDRMIVATIIQWLGSNCGMCFLGEALARFNARIVYDKPYNNNPTVQECDATTDK